MARHEAVLSALGPRQASDPVCVGAAQAVIAAMKKQGVKRLIWLSAGGVGDSAPQIIRASFVFGRIVMPLFSVHRKRRSDLAFAAIEMPRFEGSSPAMAVPSGGAKMFLATSVIESASRS